jgi:hypothetical protein
MLIGAGAATLLLLTGGSSQSVAFVGGMIAGFFALRLLRGSTGV